MTKIKDLHFPRDEFVLRFKEENGDFVCRLSEQDLEVFQYGLEDQARMAKIWEKQEKAI